MAVSVIIGDLLEATEDIIAHQVNCQAKMGSGVALQIKNKYPNVYRDYMNCFEGRKPNQLLGKMRVSFINDNKYVAHLFGQLNYGYDGKRYTNYEALYSSLSSLKEVAEIGNKSIALPYKIGCDRGGASWKIILAMIEEIFSDYQVTLYKLEG